MKFKINNLTKTYGNRTVVEGLNFSIEPGKILGLLGPNGAGKSTTIKMLSGQIKPSKGSIEIDGKEYSHVPNSFRSKIGVMPQELIIWEDLTTKENLYFTATLQGLPRDKAEKQVSYLMNALHLNKETDTIARNLSGGYQRRLNLAISIIHEPTLLFLDEPTPGIDAQSRRFLMDFIQELGSTQNYSIVLTDHYLDEAEKLSDYVVIIDDGSLVAEGTVPELKKKYGDGNILSVDLSSEQMNDLELRDKLMASFKEPFGDAHIRKQSITSLVDNPVEAIQESVKILDNADVRALNITVKEPTLEDIFLIITGKAIRE